MIMKSEKVIYNKVVNVSQDGTEIEVLDYTFDDRKGIRGATGTRFSPVSRAQYKEQTKLAQIIGRLESAVGEEDIPLQFREHDRGLYKYPYKRWAQAIIDDGDEMDMMFDTSYSELWDDIREQLELSEEEAYIFECAGGGRMFDDKYQGNFDPILSDIIRKFETESPNVKAKEELKKHLGRAIDFDGYGDIPNTFQNVFKTFEKEFMTPYEMQRNKGNIALVITEWLRGLPSCISMSFESHEDMLPYGTYHIIKLMKELGYDVDEHTGDEIYWVELGEIIYESRNDM